MRRVFLVGASLMLVIGMMITGCNASKSSTRSEVIKGVDTGKSYNVDELLSFFNDQLHRSVAKHTDYSTHPRLIELGDVSWEFKKNDVLNWTVGFYPGILWYMYDATDDEFWKNEAIK